jgi:hypothetical protein
MMRTAQSLDLSVTTSHGITHDSHGPLQIEARSVGYHDTGVLVCIAVLRAILSRLVWRCSPDNVM